MAKKLSPWCKTAKKALIDQDLDISDLASYLDLSRPYVSAILNGRANVPVTRKRISDFLRIPDAES